MSAPIRPAERLLDLVVEPRAHGPAEPTYLPIRLSGTPREYEVVAVQISMPGPRRELVVRTWDGQDPVREPVIRHRLGGMLGSAGNAYVLRLDWSPAYELTCADGGRVPIGTHVEVFGS